MVNASYPQLAQLSTSTTHPWLYCPAHLLVPLWALLRSSKEAGEELAIQRTAAPCLPPRCVFKPDGIPGVISLGDPSATAVPTLQPSTAPLRQNPAIFFCRSSFKEVFLCGFDETYRTIHLYFGSVLGWVASLAYDYRFVLVEYHRCQWKLCIEGYKHFSSFYLHNSFTALFFKKWTNINARSRTIMHDQVCNSGIFNVLGYKCVLDCCLWCSAWTTPQPE